jgi:hypothetical protein
MHKRSIGLNGLRIAAWSLAAALLLLPAIAMKFTDEVNWSIADFAFAAMLIGGVGLAYELAVRLTPNRAYRAAAGVALAAAFLLIWINAAVGIIGTEDNPANLMFGGVLVIGVAGAVIARFRPQGMARTLVAAAAAQMLVAFIALMAGMVPPYNSALQVLALCAFFAALWLAAAWLFWKAGAAHSHESAAS